MAGFPAVPRVSLFQVAVTEARRVLNFSPYAFRPASSSASRHAHTHGRFVSERVYDDIPFRSAPASGSSPRPRFSVELELRIISVELELRIISVELELRITRTAAAAAATKPGPRGLALPRPLGTGVSIIISRPETMAAAAAEKEGSGSEGAYNQKMGGREYTYRTYYNRCDCTD